MDEHKLKIINICKNLTMSIKNAKKRHSLEDIDKRTGSDYDKDLVEPEFAKRKGFKYTQNEKLINNMNKIKTNGATNKKG